jgi:hypothetical protein
MYTSPLLSTSTPRRGSTPHTCTVPHMPGQVEVRRASLASRTLSEPNRQSAETRLQYFRRDATRLAVMFRGTISQQSAMCTKTRQPQQRGVLAPSHCTTDRLGLLFSNVLPAARRSPPLHYLHREVDVLHKITTRGSVKSTERNVSRWHALFQSPTMLNHMDKV